MGEPVYAPNGLKDYLAYKERIDGLVGDGLLSEAEGFILCAVRMQSIAGNEKAIRTPSCQTCGARVTVIGKATTRFRCPCSPGVEQSISDALRRV